MSKKMLASLTLFVLALTLGIIPFTATTAMGEVVVEGEPQPAPEPVFKTYCFNSKADCEASQAAATCEKSGCYPSGSQWCYDCQFTRATTTTTALDGFLTWLSEGEEAEQ